MNYFSFKSAKYRKYLRLFWSLYTLGVISIITLFVFISFGKLGFMPNFNELENPKTLLATEIISADSVVMGKYYRENRTMVGYDEISPEVVKALIATEDARFQEHSGIDVKSLGRVIAKTIFMRESNAGGGSTITQQLAKQLFPRERFSNPIQIVIRKLREWVIAVKLEKSYTKREIISMYLNKFDFLNLAVGIKSASRIYFNTQPSQLTTNQAAMLVGMAKNPNLFNPRRRPKQTKQRRNVVLSQMVKYRYLSKTVYDSLKTQDLNLDLNLSSHKRGIATYYREFIRTYITRNKPNKSNYPQFMWDVYERNLKLWKTDPLYGWCNKNFTPDGRPYNIYKDGIKIYTTLDSRIQKHAENAVKTHLKKNIQPAFEREFEAMAYPPFSSDLKLSQVETIIYNSIRRTERYRVLTKSQKANKDTVMAIFNTPIETRIFTWNGVKDTVMSPLASILHHKKLLRSAVYSVDPRNGHVKAYVGGPDLEFFNYDMVHLGKRQVGSTIKPFLYTVALQNGISPCRKVPNTRVSFLVNDTVWSPKNAAKVEDTKTYESLNWGLAHSVNTISAWLMKRFNPSLVSKLLKQMGVESEVMAVPSIFLGTSEMTIQELTDAFAVYANKGVYNSPVYVTKITDQYGNIISTFGANSHEVLSEHVSRTMVDMLIDVVEQGTGRRLRTSYHEYAGLKEAQIAGKTGTTQAHSDGIFVGMVPKLITGIWTGGEERAIRFDDLRQGQGANLALPIFGYMMNDIYKDTMIGISKLDTFEIPLNYHKYGCKADMSAEGKAKVHRGHEPAKLDANAKKEDELQLNDSDDDDFF